MGIIVEGVRYLSVSKLLRNYSVLEMILMSTCVHWTKVQTGEPKRLGDRRLAEGSSFGSLLERVRPQLGHLSADLRAGVKIEFPEYIGDVIVHGALGEV
jgi:hypothetical protein